MKLFQSSWFGQIIYLTESKVYQQIKDWQVEQNIQNLKPSPFITLLSHDETSLISYK